MPQRVVRASRLVSNAPLIILVGIGLVLAAVVAVGVLVVRSNEADELVEQSLQIRQVGEALLADIQSAESSQRGFLLTEDGSYLQPYDHAVGTLPVQLEKLHALTADDPEMRTHVFALEPLVAAKMNEIKRTISLAQQGQREQAVEVVRTDQGRGLMEAIRSEMTSFLMTGRERLRAHREEVADLRRWLAILIIAALAGAIILVGILAIATRQAVAGLIARTHQLEDESRRREEAEDSLRQVQKMEAVGQLTGGIAHDFNNLLTIILGNLDTIKRRLADAVKDDKAPDALVEALTKPANAAVQGAKSAAQLTQRLLAFSRRQTLEPERVDLNRLVSGMLEMLTRTIGENISIETVLGAGLWPAFADAHQLENALLNLTLNAKAAMPEGGHLTIETANAYLDDAYSRRFGDVEPGQYVLLSITDTGTGIAPEILDHVFEPFFTTKPAGEGTGLGLAMVHGFVKQSGGHVRIYSEVDHGTSVKIYLPRMTGADERIAVPAGKADVGAAPRAEAGEAILLVEDNEGVRDYAKGILKALGYEVIEAPDAISALQTLNGEPQISLLFTDVVLPGSLNGRKLAEEVLRKYPDLPVLYTTGYTRNAIVHQGRLDADVNLLSKPYTEQDLARKVRELLDAS
ncbi:MAG: CHASE3 domain-containing protein [Hyphomicrobiales bacterium]